MPGGAATTAGMALRAGTAVMMWPITMKSSMVSAWKSGGGRKSRLAVTVGSPSTVIAHPSFSITQAGSSVVPFFHRTLSSMIVRPPIRPCQLAATPATWPAGIVQDAITRSSVVWAYSSSHTISSSSTPSASATIATASPNTAVPLLAIPGRSG